MACTHVVIPTPTAEETTLASCTRTHFRQTHTTSTGVCVRLKVCARVCSKACFFRVTSGLPGPSVFCRQISQQWPMVQGQALNLGLKLQEAQTQGDHVALRTSDTAVEHYKCLHVSRTCPVDCDVATTAPCDAARTFTHQLCTHSPASHPCVHHPTSQRASRSLLQRTLSFHSAASHSLLQ